MLAWIAERLAGFRFDAWELFGLIGEGLFFARLLVQWTASERARKPVLPMAYWYMSAVGAVMVGLYGIQKQSLVLLLPQLVGAVFYLRGWQLERKHRAAERRRKALGFDAPGYPWPALSLIVPVHNEEKQLPDTLANLKAAAAGYPGAVEVIVALNGCNDASRALADAAGVVVVESERSGMSFGKNLGAQIARHDWLVFVDADTRIPEDALRLLAETLHGVENPMATVAGAPDRGGGVVRTCFWIANRTCARNCAHAPGGVMAISRALFNKIGGLDETLPQGTSTDLINRAVTAGGTYVYVDAFKAVTSIRRFEKTGIVRQLFAWRRNHKDLEANRRAEVAGRRYTDIR